MRPRHVEAYWSCLPLLCPLGKVFGAGFMRGHAVVASLHHHSNCLRVGWGWFEGLRQRQRLRQRFACWRQIFSKSVKLRHWNGRAHLQVRKAWQNSYLLGCDIGIGLEQALDTCKIVLLYIFDIPTASHQPVHFNHIPHFGVYATFVVPLKVALPTNKPMQHARHVMANRAHDMAKGFTLFKLVI